MATLAREEGLKLLEKNITNLNLRKHMVAVSAVMKRLGEHLGGDPALWEAVGLLHDLDLERLEREEKTGGPPVMARHGRISGEMLKGLLPVEGLHAIMAHNEGCGVLAEKPIDYAIVAADAVSGLIIATALVMPHKTMAEVKTSSLRKRFNDGNFARSVDRNRIMVCTKLGMTLEDFFAVSLEALQSISKDLGL